ncbi:MAG: YceI family protein [Candidatus Omnitrophica bacterium]|nr:YceI family protein [Candidatus Omnitrophota bacterium]
MKLQPVMRCLMFILVMTSCNFVSTAAGAQIYKIDLPSSSIIFDANSTLHPIKGKAGDFTGEFTLQTENQQSVMQGDVSVRIESLASGNKGMDRNMYAMFQSKEYPQAQCRVESMMFTVGGVNAPVSGHLKAVLTIREVSQPFECGITVQPSENTVIVTGKTTVSLKSLRLKPPTLLGIIKVKDPVTINFIVLLKRA